MISGCKIAIVGGGLAGLAAANSLKTFGIKAEVFETAPALVKAAPGADSLITRLPPVTFSVPEWVEPSLFNQVVLP